jgi:hypothetical protein
MCRKLELEKQWKHITPGIKHENWKYSVHFIYIYVYMCMYIYICIIIFTVSILTPYLSESLIIGCPFS